ncbi:type I-E CRISPR-associated protein Cse2/CasB [Xanthobacter sp. TB0139]|uniref:type I-E CRISPR-associated protein Cse2/CasB n=1 Tax=Xanthobacter sp. TB0139 TaxID=3459178 RepID=UPI00403A1923
MSALEVGKIAFAWWKDALGDTGPGRAARAQLRRASSAAEIVSITATHDLNASLGGALISRAETLALIASALANIRETSARAAAEQMGGALSPLRFQRLVRIERPGELILPLRRALIQIEGRAHVGKLAADLFYWSDQVRNQWCFSYYGAGSTAPEPTGETEA